jgi:Cu(I)/Ag(I) efflux system membrane fusion protein
VVYIKTDSKEPVFEMREITLGTIINGSYEVLDGLENGMEIVTNGTFTVDAAAQLKGKKSMMNKEGGKTTTGHEGHTGSSMEGNTTTSMKMSISKGVQKDFMSIITLYMEVKDALVASNPEKVSNSAKQALNGLKNIKETDLDKMTRGHVSIIKDKFSAIANNSNLENQRDHFIALSDNMIAISKNLDQVSTSLFIQNCPMANKNKGADWLSWEKEIRNPYYGEAMMTCGEVKQVISK